MSILNRDYMRGSGRRSPLPAGWGAIEIIIAINAAIFLLVNFTPPDASFDPVDWFELSLESLRSLKIHTFVTYALTHRDIFHILINMFIFWQFGRIMEREWGTKRTVQFYIVAAVFSGGMHLVLTLVEGLFGFPTGIPVIGASGAVSAFIFAFAMTHASHRLMLFGLIPMTAMTLGLILVAFDVFGLLLYWSSGGDQSGDQTAHGAHLAGALYGYLYIRFQRGDLPIRSLPIPNMAGMKSKRKRSRRRSSVDYVEPAPRIPREDEQRMDALLAKVKDGGLDALTAEEREFMMDMSRRYRRT